MQVLDRPAMPVGAAWDGWAVRRDWEGGHEFVGYRQSEDAALAFAIGDQRLWATGSTGVAHSLVQIDAADYEVHAGRLCTSGRCPVGRPVGTEPAAGGVR